MITASRSLEANLKYAEELQTQGYKAYGMQVDITDLGNLATSWQSANVWTGGDLNYDGFVDITDLGMLATNWQAGVGTPLGPSFDDAVASVGLPSASVPEPLMSAAALMIVCSITRLSRNRSRVLDADVARVSRREE